MLTRASPSSLASLPASQLRPETQKEEKPPSAPETRQWRPLRCFRSLKAAVASCSRLRRAPGELFARPRPGSGAAEPDGQSQPKSAAPQSKRETPRGTSFSPRRLCARPARGSDLRLPRRVVRRDSGAQAEPAPAPLRTGGTYAGSSKPQPTEDPKTPGGRAGESRRLPSARGGGCAREGHRARHSRQSPGAKGGGVDPSPRRSLRSAGSSVQALPADTHRPPHPRSPRCPERARREGAGSAGGRSQDPREAQGVDAALQLTLSRQDLALITLAIKVATYQTAVLPRASQEPHPIAKCPAPPTPRAGARGGSCGSCSLAARSPSLRGSPRLGAQPPARRSGTCTGARAERSQRRGRSPAAPPWAPLPAALPLGAAREPRARLASMHARRVEGASPFKVRWTCGKPRAAESCALLGRRRCRVSAGSAPCSHCMASFWEGMWPPGRPTGPWSLCYTVGLRGSVPLPIQGTQHPVSIQQKASREDGADSVMGETREQQPGEAENVLHWRSFQRGHALPPPPPPFHTHTVSSPAHSLPPKLEITLSSIQPEGRGMTKMTSKSG